MTELEVNKPASYANYPEAFEADFLCMLARAAEAGVDTITLDHARGPEFFTDRSRTEISGYGKLDITSVNGLAVAALRRAGARADEFRVLTERARSVGRFDLLYLETTVIFEVCTEPCLADGARMTVNTRITLRPGPLR